MVDTSSVATITTVVTQAANLGPRTSTCAVASSVLVDMQSRSCCVGRAGCEQADTAAQSERAKTGAAALSSYNNNSNNPRRGTDRLRGAW